MIFFCLIIVVFLLYNSGNILEGPSLPLWYCMNDEAITTSWKGAKIMKHAKTASSPVMELAKLDAAELARIGGKVLGGTGGGRADMAQAGGPKVHKVGDAIQAIREAVEEKLSA